MTMKRRQIAEPRKFSNVNAARCAISVSPRRMDFCSRLLITQGSAAIGSKNGWLRSDRALQPLFYIGHRVLRILHLIDVNFGQALSK